MTLIRVYLCIILCYLSESTLEKLLLFLPDIRVELIDGSLMAIGTCRSTAQLKDELIVDQVGLGQPRVVGRTPCGKVRLSHCRKVGTLWVREGRMLRAGWENTRSKRSLYPKIVCARLEKNRRYRPCKQIFYPPDQRHSFHPLSMHVKRRTLPT